MHLLVLLYAHRKLAHDTILQQQTLDTENRTHLREIRLHHTPDRYFGILRSVLECVYIALASKATTTTKNREKEGERERVKH